MFGEKFRRKYALSDKGVHNMIKGMIWTVIVNLLMMGGMGLLYFMMKDYIPKVVYVVGDKVVSESDIRKVNPHAIKSITIYKAGSKEAKEYTGDDKSSVVMVKTKK